MAIANWKELKSRHSGLSKVVAAIFVVATVAATMAQYAGGGPPKMWWEGGDMELLPLFVNFQDQTGELMLYNYDGPVAGSRNAFFQELGSNGRACITCHQPSNAMSVSTATLQQRWEESQGRDAIFASIDGSNCPTLPQTEKTSHSLLLNRGLFRIYLPWPAVDAKGAPIKPEFTIEVVRDPTGCNTDSVYGLQTAHPTISVFRRPRMTANLKYVVGSEDLFDVGASPIHRGTLTADGREDTLESQAVSAVLAHEQGKIRPTQEQLQEILDFERQIFVAQSTDKVGGDLTEPGGPKAFGAWNLARAKVQPTAVVRSEPAFLTAADWQPSPYARTDQPLSDYRASVVRGNQIFSSRVFSISETANLDERNSAKATQGTCATCHNAALTGNDPTHAWMDIGTTVLPTAEDSPDLPLFKITCSASAAPHPYRGRVIYTTDPGRALTTGKCSDVGSVVMQQFRGLSARAPYFRERLRERTWARSSTSTIAAFRCIFPRRRSRT